MSEDYVIVPLIIYVDGVRKVVGEATLKEDSIISTLDSSDEGKKLAEYLSQNLYSAFSFSYTTEETRKKNSEKVTLEYLVPPEISERLELTASDPTWWKDE